MGDERQLGLFLRDEGIDRVLQNAGVWSDRATALFRRHYVRGEEVTAEDVRKELTQHQGLEEPHDPDHAWGALTRAWRLMELIEYTGRSKLAERKKAHARRILIWRVR